MEAKMTSVLPWGMWKKLNRRRYSKVWPCGVTTRILSPNTHSELALTLELFKTEMGLVPGTLNDFIDPIEGNGQCHRTCWSERRHFRKGLQGMKHADPTPLHNTPHSVLSQQDRWVSAGEMEWVAHTTSVLPVWRCLILGGLSWVLVSS